MKEKVIVTGGGFSGCAAAIAAARAGVEVTLLERSDMLGGAGLRAGRFRYNGKIVGDEEAAAMGGGDVFEVLHSIMIHRYNIVDEENVIVYNTVLLDNALQKKLKVSGVEFRFESRAKRVKKESDSIRAVITDSGEKLEADAFVDATGSFGGMVGCTRYGHGCVMCIFRCPIFGDRVSIATAAGAEELTWVRPDGTPGKLSPSVTLYKESLSPEMRERLEKEGAISIPIPEELIDYSRMEHFRGLRGPREVSHINLVNNGIGAKCVGMGYFSQENYRKFPGFEDAQIMHPMGGSKFNFINQLSMTPFENSLLAKNFKNLLLAGEKVGLSGIDEAIYTGALAGHNAARVALGKKPIKLPRTMAIGDIIAHRRQQIATIEGRSIGCSMGHGPYLEKMKKKGFYSTDPKAIYKRVKDLGLTGIFSQKLT